MLEQLSSIHPYLPPVVGLLALLIGAVIIDLVAKRVVVRIVRTFAKRSRVTWDDALVEHNVFGRLVKVVPALVLYAGVPFIPGLQENLVQLIRNVAMGYMVLMLTLGLTAMLSAANAIYTALPVAKDRPLQGFVQLLQIVVWVIGGGRSVAAGVDGSPG